MCAEIANMRNNEPQQSVWLIHLCTNRIVCHRACGVEHAFSVGLLSQRAHMWRAANTVDARD